jgi:predicted dinucleotide-binding enzyme
MAQKLKIAVIGLGNIGTIVATNLVKGNRPVIVADRNIEKANKLAQQLGSLAEPASIAHAIKNSDIIVLAVWFNAIKELFATYSDELRGKLIIDPSNPIAPDEKGGFKKIIDKDQSAGEILNTILPADAKLVKALGSLSAGSLAGSAFQKPEQAVLFYANDDIHTNNDVEQLIRDSGFDPVRIGGLDQSIRIEVFGDLHEFGALGKPVTLAQANKTLALHGVS